MPCISNDGLAENTSILLLSLAPSRGEAFLQSSTAGRVEQEFQAGKA